MKIIVEIVNKNQIRKDEMIAGWIVGIQGLSFSAPHLFSLDEIKEIIELAQKNNQFVMVNARRIFSDQELEQVLPLLNDLKEMPISAYFYTDFGFYQIANNKKLPLIYQAPTYVMNSLDLNYHLNENENVVLGTELTVQEMQEITKNAKRPVMIEAFGRGEIFHSRRPLLSTYFSYRGLDLDPYAMNYTIVEELRKEHFPLEQNEDGTHIYKTAFTYLLKELKDFENVSFIILSTKFLSINEANDVLDAYLTYFKTGENLLTTLNLPLDQTGLKEPSILIKERD